jgi:hypothetical protein
MENLEIIGSYIMLGFDDGIGSKYSIDGMYSVDSATEVFGDSLRVTKGNSPLEYKTPELLEKETGTGNFQYNELVINSISQQDQTERLQPSYLVYIRQKSKYEYENKIHFEQWEETVKAAAEFNVPIVVLDAEQIMAKQKNALIEKIQDKLLSENEILPSLRHFIERYGEEEIKNTIPEALIEKTFDISYPKMEVDINNGDSR